MAHEKEKSIFSPDGLPAGRHGHEMKRHTFPLSSGNTMEIVSDAETGKVLEKITHTPLGDVFTNQQEVNKLADELHRKPQEVEEMLDQIIMEFYAERPRPAQPIDEVMGNVQLLQKQPHN